jgi:arabinogalactan endo-1,4-beta-galactosidase
MLTAPPCRDQRLLRLRGFTDGAAGQLRRGTERGPQRRAIGVFYWEPTWYAVPGNGWNPADINNSGNEWDNMAVFDRNGRLNPHIRWLP